MSQVTLNDDVRGRLEAQGRAEGKTVEELVDEAVRRLLAARDDVTQLRSFVASNRDDAAARGLTVDDVPGLISDFRRERRSR